jgi:hypothetical protein
MLVAAAILAGIGIAATPSIQDEARSDAYEPPLRSPGGEELEPIPFVPPTFFLPEEPNRESPEGTRVSEPPAPPPLPRSPLSRRLDPVSMPAPRAVAKDLPSARTRSSLAVREDPYTRGFTHPTRLAERRK